MPLELMKTAREQVAAVTGHNVETISGFRRDGDGWEVTLEVLELRRVPSTMDVLVTYAVQMSDDGDLLGFEPRKRYHRAAVDDGRN
jgi:Gas vesicle synthesis protein GvpO